MPATIGSGAAAHVALSAHREAHYREVRRASGEEEDSGNIKRTRRLSVKLDQAANLMEDRPIEISRLVARLHLEIHCWDKFAEFCLILITVIIFYVFIGSLEFHSHRGAIQAVKHWEHAIRASQKILVNQAGQFEVQERQLPVFMSKLARESETVDPASSGYDVTPARLLVGPRTSFTENSLILKSNADFQVDTAWSMTAWVRYKGSGGASWLLRKSSASRSGKLIGGWAALNCWQIWVEPLQLHYRTFVDTVHAEWGKTFPEQISNIREDQDWTAYPTPLHAKFEASAEYFKHSGRNASEAARVADSMKLEDGKFHLVAVVYEYSATTMNARVRFGIDGQVLQESVGPSGSQPFPMTECPGEMLVGNSNLEVADMIWFPRAIVDADFQGLYTGALRPNMATTIPEELKLGDDFAKELTEKSEQHSRDEKARAQTHREWLYKLKQSVGDVRRFLLQGHTCSSQTCEVRVHPVGSWYKELNQSLGIISLKDPAATCAGISEILAQSVGPPVTSFRPSTFATALLDRFTMDVSTLSNNSHFLVCWQDSALSNMPALPVGTLYLTAGEVDYQEFISDASLTFKLGHSTVPLTRMVGKADAYTVTLWCQYERYTAPAFPVLFMKTLTSSPVVFSDNALVSLRPWIYGKLWWWKQVYADGTQSLGNPVTPTACDPIKIQTRMMHVAFVHVAAEQRSSLYIDGELCSTFVSDGRIDSVKVFEDGIGNITVAAGRGTNEFTGEIKQFRYYQRELSVNEITSLARSEAHRVCRSIHDAVDSSWWRDDMGNSCTDFYKLRRSFACTDEAKKNCPIACEDFCFKPVRIPTKVNHLFPRKHWSGQRLCLAHGVSPARLLDRCSKMTLAEKQKERDMGVPWANGEWLNGAKMCENLALLSTGAESCPMNFTRFQERWNSGDDWTLLWYGFGIDVYCSMLGPTKYLLSAYSDAKLYTNASKKELVSVGNHNFYGWAAISVSKAKNKIIYFRVGQSTEVPFTEVDPCIMEGITFGQTVNLRMVPQFFSRGELQDMYYREALIYSTWVGEGDMLPVQNDILQFSKKDSLVFRPYTSPILNLLPPIVWQGKELGKSKNECTAMMQAAVDMATRKRSSSFKCRSGGCEDIQIFSLKCLDSSSNGDFHQVGHSSHKVPFQGKPGVAFDLSNLQHVVVRINNDLQDPLEMLDPNAKSVHIIFALYVAPSDVVFMTIHFDRSKNPVKGQFQFMVHTDPGTIYLPAGVISLTLFVITLVVYGAKWLQHRRRFADIRTLAKSGIFGMTPSKNHNYLPEDLFCPDPIARITHGPEQFFTMASVALGVFTIPYTMIRMSSLQETLSVRVVETTAGEFSVVQRMAVLNEVLDGMYNVRQASTLCLMSGIFLVLSLISLSGFHLRTAVMVRSLKGSLSPLAHFMLIFSGSAILVAMLMYWSLSSKHDDYASPIATVNTQTDFILGSRPHTDAGDTGVNVIMHSFVTIFFMLILINMFLAIVMDSYGREMARVDDIPVEYSLFYDMWLSLVDTWRIRWSNQKKWVLAHILSTTNSNAKALNSEECFLKVVGEDHPQVTVNGSSLAFNDPIFGSVAFTDSELCAYFKHIKSMDVLWPDNAWLAENDTADHGGVDIAPTTALPDDCDVELDSVMMSNPEFQVSVAPASVVKPALQPPSTDNAGSASSSCCAADVARDTTPDVGPSTIGKSNGRENSRCSGSTVDTTSAPSGPMIHGRI